MLTRNGPENTAFIKEFQRRESKDAIHFIKTLPETKKAELTGKEGSPLSGKIPVKSVLKGKPNPFGHISDPDLLNHLSMLENINRQHMHKRDMFSEYVEAAARFNIMIKSNAKVVVPKYIPRALRPQTPGRKWYAPVMNLPPGYQVPGSVPTTSPVTPSTPQPLPVIQNLAQPIASS